MSRSTISLFKLSEMFPDESTARQFLEAHRWPTGAVCPVCKSGEKITARKNKDGFYRCNYGCGDFTVRTGTIFERSHVPLHKWLHTMYRLLTARKGISSMQLAKEIGVTQKTAWFMLHRIREACGNDPTMLKGIIEMDEAYFGGIEKNKHESKKLKAGRGGVGKAIVIGMRERGGRTKAVHVSSLDSFSLRTAVEQNILPGSMLHTDEGTSYRDMEKAYGHESVNHKAKEYSRKGVTTNSIESVWAVMKRGVHGVYHHIDTQKHLGRYISEFAFRLNEGRVAVHTLDRMASMINVSFGKRLTYRDLIKN